MKSGRRRRQIALACLCQRNGPDNRRRRAVSPAETNRVSPDCRRLLLPLFSARIFRDEFWNIGRDATNRAWTVQTFLRRMREGAINQTLYGSHSRSEHSNLDAKRKRLLTCQQFDRKGYVSVEQSSDVKFEIGHVLFIDIVGYSKLLITEQSNMLEKLKEMVRGTEQFRVAKAEGKLLALPTGDGGALVFRNSPEAAVLCAMEISQQLKKHPQLRVRMGIHSGPVNEVIDVNGQRNLAGAGINIAERVMSCGDAGHILLSKHVAEDLEQYPRWQRCLRELGECEVKHGVKVSIVNLVADGVGNAEPPQKFEAVRKHRTRVRWAEAAVMLLVLGAIIGAFVLLRRPSLESAVAAKSIAVLPFENLSSEKENAYFTDGVQDEILTDLAKIADLKVISAARSCNIRAERRGICARSDSNSASRICSKAVCNGQLTRYG